MCADMFVFRIVLGACVPTGSSRNFFLVSSSGYKCMLLGEVCLYCGFKVLYVAVYCVAMQQGLGLFVHRVMWI